MDEGAPFAQRRILIVDDAEDGRAILAIALRTIGGAVVETAGSALDALQVVTRAPADVLITDIRMGGMTGLELLSELRERGAWPSCGAIVISGETDPELPRRALESGAKAYFKKPFSAAAIRKSVISLLEECDGMA
jgi:CheY-like chemotaxis protein